MSDSFFEIDEPKHSLRLGSDGFAVVSCHAERCPEDEAECLAEMTLKLDSAHRGLTGQGLVITEIDGHETHIPVNPPELPDVEAIRALLQSHE